MQLLQLQHYSQPAAVRGVCSLDCIQNAVYLHAISRFLHSFMAISITFCCRLCQTSTTRCFSLLTVFIQHSYDIHNWLLHNTPDFQGLKVFHGMARKLNRWGGKLNHHSMDSDLDSLVARHQDQWNPAFLCSSSLMLFLEQWDGAFWLFGVLKFPKVRHVH